MALIVYGATLSPFVRKVCVALEEKGLPYQLEMVSPLNPPPEFLAISPLKKIPAFRDTDIPEPNTLSDSSVICDYIEHRFRGTPLYPTDPYLRARALWIEEFMDSAVAAGVGRGLFFERVIKKLMKQPTDDALCQETLHKTLPPLFDYLEKELGDKPYFVADTYTIADISVGSMLATYQHCDENLERWPHLQAYAKRILARPSFKKFIDQETPIVAQLKAA
ncbi:MAG: glutathione S-transferase family protein [Alphaproteobacteria bacterium]|nr:glutathione S-transferase family protein [Alphaproteobacteria bacterium]